MNLDRQLARLIAAVILMIAAYAWPSAAEAHEGHAQSYGVVSVSIQAAPVTVASITAMAGSAQSIRAQFSGPAISVADARIYTGAPAERPCDGLCCSMGTSCCAPGLLPGGEKVHVAAVGSLRLTVPETPSLKSITLEALPKPPRSFA